MNQEGFKDPTAEIAVGRMSVQEKKKAYLRMFLWLSEQEDRVIERINQIRLDKSCPSVVSDGMPRGSGGHSDLSDYAALMDEQLRALKKIRLEKYKARRGILARVSKVPDKDEQILLRLMYIKGLQIADAGEMLGYGRRKAFYKHKSALEKIKVEEE